MKRQREITAEDVETILGVFRKVGTIREGSENEARLWADQLVLGLAVSLEVRAQRDGTVEILYGRTP